MAELRALNRAHETQNVYIVGKEQMRIIEGRKKGWLRKMVLELFLWIRENARSKIVDMKIPVDLLVAVGFVKEI